MKTSNSSPKGELLQLSGICRLLYNGDLLDSQNVMMYHTCLEPTGRVLSCLSGADIGIQPPVMRVIKNRIRSDNDACEQIHRKKEQRWTKRSIF